MNEGRVKNASQRSGEKESVIGSEEEQNLAIVDHAVDGSAGAGALSI